MEKVLDLDQAIKLYSIDLVASPLWYKLPVHLYILFSYYEKPRLDDTLYIHFLNSVD